MIWLELEKKKVRKKDFQKNFESKKARQKAPLSYLVTTDKISTVFFCLKMSSILVNGEQL